MNYSKVIIQIISKLHFKKTKINCKIILNMAKIENTISQMRQVAIFYIRF